MNSTESFIIGVVIAGVTGYAVGMRSYGMAAIDALLSAFWLLRSAIAYEIENYQLHKIKKESE